MTDDLAALRIDASTVETWHDSADVVVVGAGMAGICAALQARAQGAAVLVLERSSGGTGTTAAASGHFYLGGGTPVQQACGFEDTPEAMASYLEAVSLQPDLEKITAYCEGSVAHFHWLEAHGVPFERSYYPHKNVVQPGKECLIWTGNELAWPYRTQIPPAPRGHKVAFDGEEGGGALALQRLSTAAQDQGVRTSAYCKVDALVVEHGRVVGVRLQHFDATHFVRALRGVVLAAGGFGHNPHMVAQHTPLLQKAYIQGGAYDDGLGIRLGQAAGGTLQHMDEVFLTSPFYPPEELLQGILVNRDGQRFVAEDAYHARTSMHCVHQPEGKAYLILDAAIFAYPRFAQLTQQRLIDGFETIAEMEQALHLPTGALQATMASYNQHAARGQDPQWHKHPQWLQPLTQGPYAAFDLSVGQAVYTGFTLGGLRVNAWGQVLDAQQQPIGHLYAAGACASNLAQDSMGYASGTCLGEASFFGRRAGQHAAHRRPVALAALSTTP